MRWVVTFGLFAVAAAWPAIRGSDIQNLSPFLFLWFGTAAALRVFVKRGPGPLLSLSALLLSFGAVELATLVYEITTKSPKKEYQYLARPDSAWIAEHSLVGYALKGPVDLLASASIGDELLYDSVPYFVDDLGRRPCVRDIEAPHHALFFGGSFAFGEGLPNQGTLACQFQEASSGAYQSMTYAMMGWGPGQTYVMLGVESLFSDIEQKSGVAIFSFIGDHIYRTTWKIDTAQNFPDYPFFSIADDGHLVGPFRVYEKTKLLVMRDLFAAMNQASPAFRTMVQPSSFRIISDEDAVVTTAKVLGAARQRYRRLFDGEFVVALWPRSRLEPKLEDLLVAELTEQGVLVVSVPPLPGYPSLASLHLKDQHPSASETTWVAHTLYDIVSSRGN